MQIEMTRRTLKSLSDHTHLWNIKKYYMKIKPKLMETKAKKTGP